jgi:uncharacterized protein YcbK (DUF882 family)
MQSFNPQDKISQHFTYKEVLWLPSWNRLGNESDGLDDNVLARLKGIAEKMDMVREYFGKPINVHVCWRPVAYNKQIGGATRSAHCASVGIEAAMDFDVKGLTCDEVRDIINQNNKLEEWGLRMEDNGKGSNWVHLDTRQPLPGHPRFFKP